MKRKERILQSLLCLLIFCAFALSGNPQVNAETTAWKDAGIRGTELRVQEEEKVVTKKETARKIKEEAKAKKKIEREAAKKEAKKKARFQKLLTAEGYDYYLDKETMRWISMPHSTERIVDVWIRLVPENTDPAPAMGQKYYLEHYYIRPLKKQIQFLADLEVIGRPSNNIQQKPYHMKNWEELIPGSVEYEIYQGVVAKTKGNIFDKYKIGKTPSGASMSLKDMLEEYLHISIT